MYSLCLKKRIIFLACDLKKREINISEKKTYTGTFDQVSTSETDNCLPLINDVQTQRNKKVQFFLLRGDVSHVMAVVIAQLFLQSHYNFKFYHFNKNMIN